MAGTPRMKVTLSRLPWLGPQSGLRVYRGRYVSADEVPAVNVDLGWVPRDSAWWEAELPPCPDCGNAIACVDADDVPGARKCTGCGSVFVIEAHHVQERVALCKVRRPDGEMRVYRVPEPGHPDDWRDAGEIEKRGVLVATLRPGGTWYDAGGWPVAVALREQFDALSTCE